jgi:DNA-directed RNA polymerase specialized sigma24 family protein
LTDRASSTIIDGMQIPRPSDTAEALAAVLALRQMADELEAKAVQLALRNGWSWSQIAEALGVSKQAAHKRLSHLQPSK